jgi:hypothetical protein
MNLNQQERFSRLQFPVHKVQAKTPEELFQILPGLRRYFQTLIKAEIEFSIPNPEAGTEKKSKTEGYEAMWRGTYPEDLVRVIKYIVFTYDPDSDLIHEYADDLRLIKEAAAKEAGFSRNKDGEWPLYIQEIFDFKQKHVVSWIVDYLKVKKNSIWMEIKFIEEEIDLLYRNRTAALLAGTVKEDSMRLIDARNEKKESLYKRFYAEHTDLKKATEDEIYPVSPENVFKELKIPQDIYKVRQVKDVLKTTGVDQIRN